MPNGREITCRVEPDKRHIVQYHYWREGSEWHRYTHKNGGNADENIDDTLRDISDSSLLYVVEVEGENAAYFVKHVAEDGTVVMEGFHVNSDYRRAWFMHEFWKIVKEKMGLPFSTGVYEANEQAIKHLVKQGFEQTGKTEDQNKIFYIFKLT